MNNRGLLLLIVVLLVAVVFMMMIEDTADRSPVKKVTDSINEVTEEIKDEIDDNTTAPNP